MRIPFHTSHRCPFHSSGFVYENTDSIFLNEPSLCSLLHNISLELTQLFAVSYACSCDALVGMPKLEMHSRQGY